MYNLTMAKEQPKLLVEPGVYSLKKQANFLEVFPPGDLYQPRVTNIIPGEIFGVPTGFQEKLTSKRREIEKPALRVVLITGGPIVGYIIVDAEYVLKNLQLERRFEERVTA